MTTGCGNTFVGGYDARDNPTGSDRVVLSDAGGRIRVQWDAAGNRVDVVNPLPQVPEPLAEGTLTVAFDAGALVYRVRMGGSTWISRTVRSHRAAVAAVRPQDVTETRDQMTVTAAGGTLAPEGWTSAACRVPTIRYAATQAPIHSGYVQAVVSGLPAEAATMGFDVDITGLGATQPLAFAVEVYAVTAAWACTTYQAGAFRHSQEDA